MRRRIDIEPKSLFQGREFARLMTLFIMLGVIGMLMMRAKDPDTWALFDRVAGETKRVDDLTASSQQSTKSGAPSSPSNSSLVELGPGSDLQKAEESKLLSLDEDPAERDALNEELEAITDNERLQAIEMPAYYRLVRWATSQPVEALQRKSQRNVPFRELFDRPKAYRGKLIDIRLKVRRVIRHTDLEKDNAAGIDLVWELLGYNDSSGRGFYTGVTPTLPGKMTTGESVTEDGRFVGYFLKLKAYEDGEGKNRATPLLIGRFIWDPPVLQKSDPAQQRREFMWGLVAVSVIGLALLARWGIRRIGAPSSRAPTEIGLRELRRRRSLRTGADDQTTDIESWLTQSEPPKLDPAINPSDPPESEGK